jgi:hypothetical protein
MRKKTIFFAVEALMFVKELHHIADMDYENVKVNLNCYRIITLIKRLKKE